MLTALRGLLPSAKSASAVEVSTLPSNPTRPTVRGTIAPAVLDNEPLAGSVVAYPVSNRYRPSVDSVSMPSETAVPLAMSG